MQHICFEAKAFPTYSAVSANDETSHVDEPWVSKQHFPSIIIHSKKWFAETTGQDFALNLKSLRRSNL